MKIEKTSPKFQVASDKAILVLGHSERYKTGEYFASVLDKLNLFDEIDIFSLNKCAAALGRSSVQKAMENRTVITHSAGLMRVKKALQVIALNPPEPVPLIPLIKRGLIDIPRDHFESEEGAHSRTHLDIFMAGVELARSPITTLQTVHRISRGYSSTDRLVNGSEDFRAGRAMVHSELDAFGFAQLANMERAAQSGVTTVMLPNHHHNEALFAAEDTIKQLTPVIFPEEA